MPPLALTLGQEVGADNLPQNDRVDSNGSKVGPYHAFSCPTSCSHSVGMCWPLAVGRPLPVGTDCWGTGVDHFSEKTGHLGFLG
jgi:hypothetical protein